MISTMPGQPVYMHRVELRDSGAGQKASLKCDGKINGDGQAMAKLKLSHTPAEHQLYESLLDETHLAQTHVCAFSTHRLMTLAQLPNHSAVRRAVHGLINKRSIEEYRVAGDLIASRKVMVYLVYGPEEILARREAHVSGVSGELKEQFKPVFDLAIERVADFEDLSRREAQVALCCAEGLTNTEIGSRLHISVQTVKYHLRHIFVKYKVKRRTELVSRLLSQPGQT